MGALLKHENEQKKKISHACKEKDLSLSKHSCKKNYKKRYFWCVQWNGGSNHHGFQGCVHQKDPPDHRFHCYMKIRGRGG